MPDFTTKDGGYFVSYITGPSHILLGVKFSDQFAEPRLVKQPSEGKCFHGLLDELEIRAAVQDVLAAFREEGVNLYAEEILYDENDSPRYDLYRIAAYHLVKHYISGSEFKNVI